MCKKENFLKIRIFNFYHFDLYEILFLEKILNFSEKRITKLVE